MDLSNFSFLQKWKLYALSTTLWFQLEDMFLLIGTPQGIEEVTVPHIFKNVQTEGLKNRGEYFATDY